MIQEEQHADYTKSGIFNRALTKTKIMFIN
jgi:hypothetical protein